MCRVIYVIWLPGLRYIFDEGGDAGEGGRRSIGGGLYFAVGGRHGLRSCWEIAGKD